MSLLKKLLVRKPNVLNISKEEIEILTYVFCNRTDFESWLAAQKQNYPKVKFVFYYPNAVDFYYDTFKLFTVYFKRDVGDQVQFDQLKISRLNEDSLKSYNWKPFKDVFVSYLLMAQERNSDLQFKRLHALHEYQALCDGEAVQKPALSQPQFLNLALPDASL